MVAVRWHFNPDTGKTGRCRAEIKCDFGEGTPHYETKEAAQKGYEEYQAIIDGWVSTLGREAVYGPEDDATKITQGAEQVQDDSGEEHTSDTGQMVANVGGDTQPNQGDQQVQPPEDEEARIEALDQQAFEEHDGPDTFTIPVGAVEDARKLIDRANKRLERAGISERFKILEETPFSYTTVNDRGFKEHRNYVALRLNHPSISYSGYRFLAVVDKADTGLVVRGSEELGGWRPEKQVCEHCGKNMRRSKTYLVEDKEGNRLQVGSTCMKAYLGVKPEGLWAVGTNPLNKLDRSNRGYGGLDIDNKSAIAYALALSENGRHFVSKSMWERDSRYKDTTRDLVYQAMYGKDNERWSAKVAQKAEEYIRSGRVDEVLEQARNVKGDSDYCENMRTLASGKYIHKKHLGMLVSAVAIDAKNRRDAEKKKHKEEELKSWTPGYAANVGDNLKGRQMRVIHNRIVDGYDYHGNSIRKSVVTLRDEEGHQVTWFASRPIRVKEGEDITLGSAKVKKHGQYEGVDQTVISNVRVPGEMSQKEWNDYYG